MDSAAIRLERRSAALTWRLFLRGGENTPMVPLSQLSTFQKTARNSCPELCTAWYCPVSFAHLDLVERRPTRVQAVSCLFDGPGTTIYKDVISHFERLNSIHTEISRRSARMAVGS